ncbi:hypothetical protein BDV36DRAFT_257719 [Aspergillus pseudocaelatus]|uniref:Uncharacterized protein n=1 Tax=Aspergillus pseudocaelatus TaxID=1825620 RepID=A0ABQ6WJ77_9EURO|nr:hypothetical protein BDV36DRAFT_257719 [Aspergillus pseudocaelatus]
MQRTLLIIPNSNENIPIIRAILLSLGISSLLYSFLDYSSKLRDFRGASPSILNNEPPLSGSNSMFNLLLMLFFRLLLLTALIFIFNSKMLRSPTLVPFFFLSSHVFPNKPPVPSLSLSFFIFHPPRHDVKSGHGPSCPGF